MVWVRVRIRVRVGEFVRVRARVSSTSEHAIKDARPHAQDILVGFDFLETRE